MNEYTTCPVQIQISFKLDFNLNLLLPEKTVIDELEKFILSRFSIDDSLKLDILQSNKGKLSKKEKATMLGMSKYNEFSVNLNDLFEKLFKTDYTQIEDKIDLNIYRPPFIPPFYLKLDEEETIGSGSFGKIHKCYFQDQKLAIKFLNQETFADYHDIEKSFEREINTYIKLNHRNIPKFLGVTYINGKGKGIMMENIDGRKLISLAENTNEFTKLHYLKQLSEVVCYLHENKIFHRDLKPDNIIITENNELMLIDYGLSKLSNMNLYDKSCISTIKTLFSSSENVYKCPQIDLNDDLYDLWSFGCIVYFLYTNSHPWGSDLNKMKTMFEQNINFYSPDVIQNPFILDIISKCCDYNLNNRLSFPEINKKIEYYTNFLANQKLLTSDLENEFSIFCKCPSFPELFENLGNVYIETSKFDKAIFCFQRLLSIKLADLTENNLQIADIYIKLGSLYFQLSKFSEAKKFVEKACLIIIKIDPDNKLLFTAYEYAGKIYFMQSIFSSAQDFYQRSLNLRRKLFGEIHIEIANIYDNLGYLFFWLKDFIRAIESFEKSIKIRIELLLKDNNKFDAAKLLEIKGIHDMSKSNYSSAKDNLDKSLSIKISFYGENNLDVANTYYYIGLSYQSQLKFNRSTEFFEKASKIYMIIIGENNIEIANCYHNVGYDCYLQGQFQKALEYYEKSLKIKSHLVSDVNISIALSYYSIGLTLIGIKDYFEALKYFENSLSISMSLLGEDHFSINEIYYNIGVVNEKLKNFAIAEEYFKISKKPKINCLIF